MTRESWSRLKRNKRDWGAGRGRQPGAVHIGVLMETRRGIEAELASLFPDSPRLANPPRLPPPAGRTALAPPSPQPVTLLSWALCSWLACCR